MRRREVRHRWAAAAVALIAGVGAAVAVPALAPGDAPPATASFTARDFAWEVTGDTVHTVTLAVGGTVSFGYPTGISMHNADFSGGPAPSSCTQTAGADSGAVPPLPARPTAAGWTGTCRFDAVGTYTFHCDLHPTRMQGTIEVVDPSATTPTTTGTPTTQTGTTTAPGQTSPPPGGSPPPAGGGGTAARLRVSIAHRQHGVVVRGTVTTPLGRSRVVVAASASNRVLALHRPRRLRRVRVGVRRTRSSAAGAAPFALRLSRSAQAALHRRGRLTVVLRIVVTPPDGRSVVRTVAVALTVRAPASDPGYAY